MKFPPFPHWITEDKLRLQVLLRSPSSDFVFSCNISREARPSNATLRAGIDMAFLQDAGVPKYCEEGNADCLDRLARLPIDRGESTRLWLESDLWFV